jgi:hypothetical protein
MTIALILFFTLPGAISLGSFKREWTDGQLDVLSTMPEVSILHSMMAWCLMTVLGAVLFGVLGFFFFNIILSTGRASIVVLGLMLLAISLGKIIVQ